MRVFALRGHQNGNDETIEYVENVKNVEYATSLVELMIKLNRYTDVTAYSSTKYLP